MEINMSFEQFSERFNHETDCIDALFQARWPNGFRCPGCACTECYTIATRRLPLFECRSCRRQTSIIAGTIFEGSRVPLKCWLQALFLHAIPGGVSAFRLSRILKITYKTAWLMCHKIRHAMMEADAARLLTGLVRVNYGEYGKPFNPTIYRHYQEQPMLAGASLTLQGNFEYLKIKKVPEQYLKDGWVLPSAGQQFRDAYVEPQAAPVIVVVQKFCPTRFLPLIHVCRQAADWINRTFCGIGPKHLQSYLDQFCYSFNARVQRFDVFSKLLEQSTVTPVLKYPQLIRRPDVSQKVRVEFLNNLKRINGRAAA